MDEVIKIMEACEALQALLKADQACIKQNAIQEIEENNKEKKILIDSLTRAVNDLTMPSKIDAYPKRDQLKLEVEKCNRFIEINAAIVSENLKKYHEIWGKLTSLNSSNATYDEKGNVNK